MGAIAADTCQFTKNILKAERSILGKAAFKKLVNTSELVWGYFMVGCEIQDPELAAQLKKARAQRFAINAAVLLVGFAAVFQATLGHSRLELRRPQLTRSTVRQMVRREYA